MDDNEQREAENKHFNEMMDHTDGASGYDMDPDARPNQPVPSPTNSLPSYDGLEIAENKDVRPTRAELPIEKKKKKLVPKKAKEMDEALLTSTINDAVTKAVNEAVKNSITPTVTRIVEDAVTCIVKHVVDIRTNINQLSSTRSNFNISPQVAHSPRTPTVPVIPRSYPSRDYSNTPTSSRSLSSIDHSRPPIARRSRSRSPIPHRRDHSRSPIRPSIAKPHSAQQKIMPKCCFCQGTNHMSKNCNVITSLSARNAIVTNDNRCPKCFRFLDRNHLPTCEPPLCTRGCRTRDGQLERHCDYFCPLNRSLTR